MRLRHKKACGLDGIYAEHITNCSRRLFTIMAMCLGHFICNTMRDDTDILRQRRQLYARANVLARKFYMCTDEVKVLLFRTFCCNLYTCQLWWNFTQTAMRKINVAYNNAFRMIMQLPRYCSASNMFAMCNVPSCQAVMRNLVYRFRGTCLRRTPLKPTSHIQRYTTGMAD